jgi:hypothetical protein
MNSRKIENLITLVRHTPAVRSCIQRVFNEVVPSSVLVQEHGKDLTLELQNFLGPVLSAFLEGALEMAYMCGFVVFVCRKYKDIPVPLLLPLGSFTWSVQVTTQKSKKRKREGTSLYRYDVRPIHPEVTVDELCVFNFCDPVVDGEFLPSPLDQLVRTHAVIQDLQANLLDVIQWNSVKHIATSERVDHPKDQTTEGISLLDEFRRYLITGSHTGVNRFYMTVNGALEQQCTDPTELTSRLIHDSFGMHKNMKGEKASVHVLPPNTEVSELVPVDPKLNMLEIQEVFQRQVIQFFHMTAQPDINNRTKRARMEMSDIKYTKHMCRFGTAVVRFAYACLFDIDENYIFVQLENPGLLALETLEDVKDLAEMQILLPSDKLKIRKLVMKNV